MITFNASELAKLHDRLQAVTEKVAKKALRSAARRGMNQVRKDARANAPKDVGLLDQHFSLLTKFKGPTLYVKVGIKGGAKKNPETPYYFRMVELGTRHIQARPFLRPALEGNAQQVFDTIVEGLKEALSK